MNRHNTINPDGAIRLAILDACSRHGQRTWMVASEVYRQTGTRINSRQAANMAARLHRRGLLTYDASSRHVITDEGRHVLALFGRVGQVFTP